eukprot:4960349-Alexandrium_andersonii.AAC.1
MIARSTVSAQATACPTRCGDHSCARGMSRRFHDPDAGLPPVKGRQPSAQAETILCAEPPA